MSCQWYPTILTPALGWVAANSDTYPPADCFKWLASAPVWAGVARGSFQFRAGTNPARLWNRAAREAELGRYLPAADPPGKQDDWVQYWEGYPGVLGIRNNSGVAVTLVALDDLRCGPFSAVVAASTEVAIGPWWGRGDGFIDVQVFGPTPGAGGVRTVPSGVDVRVTTPARQDPGLSAFSNPCSAPAVVLV